ncbi:hypothetical protein [Pseudomonas frederiksbergensis]|jgi:hypothetical protein|uniref:hypothetical protein n=1 Tax=Pseudomonas frederiksbergensis TaxID=104087 RepID=UPI002DBCFFBB|nr:hypothetical protein [Pseudomonas frederiksbergensis]WRV67770.1 hypothetical protein VQ575_23355 [Pseudomonas frederiksbergensis]
MHHPDGELDLEVEKEHVVYGIEFWNNCPWYYLCTDEHDEYPIPLAADLFEVIDKRLSGQWQLYFEESYNGHNHTKLVFSEWATDKLFYENLISGDVQAEETFKKFRQIMETEFLE